MPDTDSLRRLGGGRWETRDGRFAIEPQAGTWVIVDNEQTDELGLPLVRGPFGSLASAKEAIEAARTEGPKASPLAERIERARETERTRGSKGAPAGGDVSGREPGRSTASNASKSLAPGAEPARPEPPGPAEAAKAAKPESPPEPRWLRELEPADQRRARDLIARLERMGVDDPERVVRAEVADGQPALARLAIERALAKSLAGSKDSGAGAVRATVNVVVGGADVELRVSWCLVDGEGRRIDKVEIPGN